MIGVGSALLTQGHDGLALSVGLAAAAFLWIALLAPAHSWLAGPADGDALGGAGRDVGGRSGTAEDLTSLVDHRFGSPLLGVLMRLLLVFATVLIVVAELRIAAAGLDILAGQRGVGGLVAVGGFGIVAVVLATIGRRWLEPLAAVIFAAVAGVVGLALVAIVWQDGLAALVGVPAVPEIAALEQRLVDKRLADPAQLRAHTAPFLKTDALNFVALVVVVALGFAAIVGGYGRASATASTRRAAALMVLALLVALPPLAATGKRALLASFDGGIAVSAPPAWLAAHVTAGQVELCGKVAAPVVSSVLSAAMSVAASAADLCGRGFGPKGLLRWQDAQFSREGLPYAALEAAGAPRSAGLLLIVAAILAAAILAARASMVLLARSYSAGLEAGTARRAMMSVGVVAATAAVTVSMPLDFTQLFALAASVAACAVIPALLVGSLFQRPAAMGVIGGMAIGVAVTIGLSLVPRIAPVAAMEASGAIASLPPALVRRIATLAAAPVAPASATKAALRPTPVAVAPAEQLARIAEDRVTWLGLRPIASGLIGLALACLLGFAVAAGAAAANAARRGS